MNRFRNYFIGSRWLWKSKLGVFGITVLLAFALMAAFAPALVRYDPLEYQYTNDRLARSQPPSTKFWFGTTYYGQDVFSQVIMGSRIALIVGVVAAFFISFIGTNIGLLSGYFGGRVDTLLMRMADVAFGIPFLPFAIVLITLTKPSVWNIIFTISTLLWRTTARVVRSQVLSLKERPFIKAARVSGASDWRIIYVHLLPNVLPISFLYMSLGIAWSTLSEASLSFLGFGDPRMISWGRILYSAFQTGSVRGSWWVVLPPGLAIALFVVSAFMIGFVYEERVNPRLRGRK